MPANVELERDNIRWAGEKLAEHVCKSTTAEHLYNLLAKIERDAPYPDEVELFLRLVPDLFALNYEAGYNPLKGEADDISPWDLLHTCTTFEYRLLASLDKIEVVCQFSDFASEVRIFLLGRTKSNTYPLMVEV
jgi:hypothetical protein